MTLLTTDRLILRTLREEDAPVIYDYRSNELCSKYQRGQVKKPSEISSLIKKHKDDTISCEKRFMLGIELRETGELVGEISVMPSNATVSLGYTLSYKHHRNGYASEALSALLSLMHERYPQVDFICFTDPNNIPSMRLLDKLGYEHLGYIPHMDSEVFGKWLLPSTREEIESAVKANKSDPQCEHKTL